MADSTALCRSLQLQERDLILLQGLFESRIMTAGHIASIYFGGKSEAAKKRLQKLKNAGFIDERRRRVNEPAILFLTRSAIELLRSHQLLSVYPAFSTSSLERRAQIGDLTLRHELEVLDVKAAFYSALAEIQRFQLVEFSTWPLLHQFESFHSQREGAMVLVKPDGYIRIHEEEPDGGMSEHTYFLEVDRSTETQDSLLGRAGCYLNYYRSGGYALRKGADSTSYKDYPFRVLMVFKSAERRNNTAERLLANNPPIFTHAYLSTLSEVTRNPFGAIWIRPVDYRDATEGAPPTLRDLKQTAVYRRNAEREAQIEARIKKHRILATTPLD